MGIMVAAGAIALNNFYSPSQVTGAVLPIMQILDWNNPTYIGDIQQPLYWRDERSGVLKEALERYVYWAADPKSIKPDEAQFYLIKQYLRYWINAPCWRGELSDLRTSIETVRRVEDIEPFLDKCLEWGIDPL